MRTDCRARIFEICSRSHSASSDVSLPAGSMAMRRRVVLGLLNGLIIISRPCRALSLQTATCVVNRVPMPTSHRRGFERFDEFISDQHHLHVGERLCEASTCSCEMEGYVEKCELSF